MMEQRQFLGLDPFAPPCDEVLRGLPVYPILAARATVAKLLANQDEFRNLVRMGQPTGSLDTPPVINLSLFERIAEARPQQGPELLSAAKIYVRESYDANELVEFATRCRREGGDDSEVCR